MKTKLVQIAAALLVGVGIGWFAKSMTLPRYELRQLTQKGTNGYSVELLYRINIDDGTSVLLRPKPSSGSAS